MAPVRLMRIAADLSDPLARQAFHDAVRAQWVPPSSAGLATVPPPFDEPAWSGVLGALAHLKQNGLVALAGLIPRFMSERRHAMQLYCTSRMADAARHLYLLQGLIRTRAGTPLGPPTPAPVDGRAAVARLWWLAFEETLSSAVLQALARGLPSRSPGAPDEESLAGLLSRVVGDEDCHRRASATLLEGEADETFRQEAVREVGALHGHLTAVAEMAIPLGQPALHAPALHAAVGAWLDAIDAAPAHLRVVRRLWQEVGVGRRAP